MHAAKVTALVHLDLLKIYFFGVCVSLLYGLSPAASDLFFGEQLSSTPEYTLSFAICAFVFFGVIYPVNRRLSVRIELAGLRLHLLAIAAIACFVAVQMAAYSDFYSAFVAAYTDRTGTQFDGWLRFVFYPASSLFLYMTFVYVLILVHGSNSRTVLALAVTAVSTLLLIGLGSRNNLLWCYAGVLAAAASRCRYRTIVAIVLSMYLFAVVFAFVRNTGAIAALFGFVDLQSELSAEYFNPIIHEFGSPYRLFETIATDPAGREAISQAPYNLVESFFLNMLPSFAKPDDFVGFTDYLSVLYANPGEGVGSSPMIEAFVSNYASLVLMVIVAWGLFWPAIYSLRFPFYSFLSGALSIAVYFNIWRIGSAEVVKLFLAIIVVAFITKPLLGLRVERVSRMGVE